MRSLMGRMQDRTNIVFRGNGRKRRRKRVGLGSFNLPMTEAGERASRVIMILYLFCRRSTVRRSLCDNDLRDISNVYDDTTSLLYDIIQVGWRITLWEREYVM